MVSKKAIIPVPIFFPILEFMMVLLGLLDFRFPGDNPPRF